MGTRHRLLGYPVAIRFAHEMNGYWYPWCEQSNGNSRGEYVQAWRHIHQVFDAAGAHNAVWVWSPNVSYTNSTPLTRLYPGDAYVDWVGLSGYYGTVGKENYQSFDALFTPTRTELRRFTRKPLVITEVGATDAAGRKAEWITGMFRSLPRHRDIIGVIWYQAVKEIDWRVGTSPRPRPPSPQALRPPATSSTGGRARRHGCAEPGPPRTSRRRPAPPPRTPSSETMGHISETESHSAAHSISLRLRTSSRAHRVGRRVGRQLVST